MKNWETKSLANIDKRDLFVKTHQKTKVYVRVNNNFPFVKTEGDKKLLFNDIRKISLKYNLRERLFQFEHIFEETIPVEKL